MAKRDPSLDTLLLLDGESFVVEADGKYWVKFVVKEVPVSPERPQGLTYSLTLHDEDGERLLVSIMPIRFVRVPGRVAGRGLNTTTSILASVFGFTTMPMQHSF